MYGIFLAYTALPCLACLSGGQTLYHTVSGPFPDESAAGKPSWSLHRTSDQQHNGRDEITGQGAKQKSIQYFPVVGTQVHLAVPLIRRTAF